MKRLHTAAIVAATTMAALGTITTAAPASADDEPRFVTETCTETDPFGNGRTWTICDKRYDSTSLDNYRQHVLTVNAHGNNGSVNVRLRGTIEHQGRPYTVEGEAKNDADAKITVTVSGDKTKPVSWSLAIQPGVGPFQRGQFEPR